MWKLWRVAALGLGHFRGSPETGQAAAAAVTEIPWWCPAAVPGARACHAAPARGGALLADPGALPSPALPM